MPVSDSFGPRGTTNTQAGRTMHPIAAIRSEAITDTTSQFTGSVPDAAGDHGDVIEQGIQVVYDEIDKRLPAGPYKTLATSALSMAMNFVVKALLRHK